MAKKGRAARLAKTLNRGTLSTALKTRDANASKRGEGPADAKKSEWRKRKDRAAQRDAVITGYGTSGLPHGYHGGQRVLLLGEGNFTFR